MQTIPIRLMLIVPLLIAGWLPGAAQEVGRFAVVQNEVSSLRPGSSTPVPAVTGAAILLDELERTGAASAAKMTFGEGAVISIGQNTEFKVSATAVDQATGASVSKLDLFVGKVRVFVSRFWSGRPEVQVNTPTAVVGIKGSEVQVGVTAAGQTTVTVFGGSAWVRRLDGQGGTRSLGPGEQIIAQPGAALPSRPSRPDAATLVELRASTEPELRAERPAQSAALGAEGEAAMARVTAIQSALATAIGSAATETAPEVIEEY